MDNSSLRVLFLITICTIPIGTFYYYDFPGALTPRFQNDPKECRSNSTAGGAKDCLNFNPYTYNLLYTVAAGSNGVLALFGGISADAFGAHRVLILYILLSTLGSVIFASAPLYLSSTAVVPVLIVARAILSGPMGAMRSSQNKLALSWFEPVNKRALALSSTDMALRIGTISNFFLTPSIADWVGLRGAMWMGPILCSVGCAAAVLVYYFHTHYAERMQVKQATAKTKVRLSDFKKFPLLYWLVIVQGALLISSITILVANLAIFFQARYFYESHHASYMVAVCYITSLAMPLFGMYVVDVYGRQAQWLVTSCSCLVIVYTLFYISTATTRYPTVPWFPPLVGTILMGVVYSTWTASWVACIAIVTPRGYEAIGFSLPFALFDFGSSISALVVGRILNKAPNTSPTDAAIKYNNMIMYFLCLSGASLFMALLVYWRDRTTRRLLSCQRIVNTGSTASLVPSENESKTF